MAIHPVPIQVALSPRSEVKLARQGSVVWRTRFTSGDCVKCEHVRDKRRVRYDSSAIIGTDFAGSRSFWLVAVSFAHFAAKPGIDRPYCRVVAVGVNVPAAQCHLVEMAALTHWLGP